MAGKLRGLHGWADTHTAGRCGRVGALRIKERQYESRVDMTIELRSGLLLLRRLSERHLAWRVTVINTPGPPLIVYSDASYEPGSGKAPRLGWLIYDPLIGQKPVVAATLDVPLSVVSSWTPREQQIFAAEAFAPVSATYNHPSAFYGRDVLWFIDNEAAAATLIRGASREKDVCEIAECTHLLWAHLRCRVWVEWIDSDSNPSDGLSRDGIMDQWCLSRDIPIIVAAPPPWDSPTTLAEDILSSDYIHCVFSSHHLSSR